MACTSGCATQNHESYSDCLRQKSLRVSYCNSAAGLDYTAQKKWDRELSAYKDARAEGIQPSGTSTEKIENAKRISDATGSAWQGG